MSSSRTVRLRTTGPAETRRVAEVVAGVLVPGDVVALTGELGAGKTCFVQGAAAALGVTAPVTSPSFVLRRDYDGRVPVLHLDVYRLESLQEVVDLGYEEAVDRQRVTFIEWGDAMAPLLPTDHLEVELRLPPLTEDALPEQDPEPRTLLVRPHGPDWTRRIGGLLDELAPWQEAE